MYLVMQNRDRVSFPSSSDLETFCGYVESLSNMVCKVLREEEGCTRYEESKTVKNGPIASRANLARKAVCKTGLIAVDDGEAHSPSQNIHSIRIINLKML